MVALLEPRALVTNYRNAVSGLWTITLIVWGLVLLWGCFNAPVRLPLVAALWPLAAVWVLGLAYASRLASLEVRRLTDAETAISMAMARVPGPTAEQQVGVV